MYVMFFWRMYLNDDTLDTIDKSSGRIHRVHVAKEDDLGSQENTENQVLFFGFLGFSCWPIENQRLYIYRTENQRGRERGSEPRGQWKNRNSTETIPYINYKLWQEKKKEEKTTQLKYEEKKRNYKSLGDREGKKQTKRKRE